MSAPLKTDARFKKLSQLVEEFSMGMIQVSRYHRGFVWKHEQQLALLDSIKNSYPIGMFVSQHTDIGEFWSADGAETVIGGYFAPRNAGGFYYIIDGYQRLSVLIGCLVNPSRYRLNRDDKDWDAKFNIVYNLEEDRFEHVRKDQHLSIYQVAVYKFMDSKEFYYFRQQLESSNVSDERITIFIKRFEQLSRSLRDCQIPYLEIYGGSEEQAIEIFSRINIPPAKVSDIWKASALSINKFHHSSLEEVMFYLKKDLSQYGFQEISHNTILTCVLNVYRVPFSTRFNKDLLAIMARREDFTQIVEFAFDNIKKAVAFLRNDLQIINCHFLPYWEQLIYVAHRFHVASELSQILRMN